jgi:hypothetical protein
MGAPTSAPATQSEDFKAFTETLKHLIEVNSMQQAGYIRPMSADEVDRRAAGLIEMRALLREYEEKGTPPLYVVGENDIFFECANAVEYGPGSQIRTYLPPSENFIPKNEQAEMVYAAMVQWIGGKTPGIGEQVEAAIIASKQAPPLVTGALQPERRPGLVELVDEPKVDVSRKRVSGTIVPERHGLGVADRAATGPVFVGEQAA